MILLVPPPKPVGSSVKLLLAFTFEAWIFFVAIILIALVSASLFSIAPKNVRTFILGENVTSPNVNILIIILGGSQKTLPKTTFARFLLMMFMIFCFVVRSGFYQGKLYDILKSEIYAKEISTFDEYYDLNYRFYMYQGLALRLVDFKYYKT